MSKEKAIKLLKRYIQLSETGDVGRFMSPEFAEYKKEFQDKGMPRDITLMDWLIKKVIELLESEPEPTELNLSNEFVQALINDVEQSSRLKQMPNKFIIELLTNRVWGRINLMTFESNLLDEAIDRLGELDRLTAEIKTKDKLIDFALQKLKDALAYSDSRVDTLEIGIGEIEQALKGETDEQD
jgi:hypothetical protein